MITPPKKLKFDRFHVFSYYASAPKVQIKRAVDVRATDLVAMLNDNPQKAPEFEFRGGRDSFLELHALGKEAGVDVSYCSWVAPNATYVNALADAFAALEKDAPPRYFVLDIEGEFRFGLRDHAKFVIEVMLPAFAKIKTPVMITGFGFPPKDVTPAVVWADEKHEGGAMPQIYPVWQGEKWQESPLVQPDAYVPRAFKLWGEETSRILPIFATFGDPLPFRFQDGKRVNKPWGAGETLRVCLEQAQAAGAKEFAVWVDVSLSKDNQDAREWRDVLATVEITRRPYFWAAPRALQVAGAAGIAVVIGGTVVYLSKKLWDWYRGMGGKGKRAKK